MVRAPRNSHPGPVEDGQIGSHQFEDFGRIGAVGTRALEVDLAAKLVRQWPPHSIDDKTALDPEDDMPKEGHSARWLDVAPHPSSGGCIGFEKTRERGTPLPRIDVQRPAWDASDPRLWRQVVTVHPGRLTWLSGQKRSQWAQRFAGAPEPLPHDLDDRMRPTGFTQVVEHEPGLTAPAHEAGRASIRSERVPEGQRPLLDRPPAGGDRNQFAGGQVRQLGACLRIGRVKLTCHEEVVGRPALRGSAHFGDKAAGGLPFAAEGGAMPFAGQRHGREFHRLEACQANVFVSDAADPSPELVRRIAQQSRRRTKRQVFASPADGLLQGVIATQGEASIGRGVGGFPCRATAP